MENTNITSYKKQENNICVWEDKCQGLTIIKTEGKARLDGRLNIPLKEKISPMYHFELNGKRISKDYYSIESLSINPNHFIVTELDFMYTLGYDEWESQYGNEFEDVDFFHFKFHKGIVNFDGEKINEVIPVLYNRIKETNNKIVFMYGDPDYDVKYYSITNERNFKFKKTPVGAINLDPDSEFYGYIIAPPVFDRICDFDLNYEGYAEAKIDDKEGYISKNIDINKYESITKLLYLYNNNEIDYKTYKEQLPLAVSDIIITEQEVINEIKKNDKKVSFDLVFGGFKQREIEPLNTVVQKRKKLNFDKK